MKITYFYNYKTDQIKIKSLIASAFELWNRPTKFHLANQSPLTAYLYSLCVVKLKCITLLRHNLRISGKGPFSKTPLSAGNRALFVRVCFHLQCPLLLTLQYYRAAQGWLFLQHNDSLCDKIGWANLSGYSHRCRLTQGCQRGLLGQAGLEVQVDPSVTQVERHFQLS